MRIRLTRKLARQLNGVDLAHLEVGDVIDLPRRDAQVLIAEGWARPVSDGHSDDHAKSSRQRSRPTD